jgi:type I restriction enzyme, S subunit
MINTNYLQKKVLIDCLEFLGRGQSPSYIEEESEILAINQKCVRNSTVDISYARAHNSRVIVKDNAILQNGDICINSTGTGTIGRIGLWSSESQIFDNQYFADSHVTVARPDKTKVNPKYLAALLESEKIQTSLETYCFSGSTNQIELNKAALSELSIEIIPIEAQHIVADILSTIDLAITQTEAIIAKQQRIKTGLMQDLLTKGIDENGNIRSEATHEFKDSSIGRIPVEWEVVSIDDISTKITDGDHHTPARSIDGIFLLSARNILNGSIDLSDVDYVPDCEYQRMIKRCYPEAGDIFISCSGTIGRVCEVPTWLKCVLVRSAALVKLDKSHVQPRFAEWTLRSDLLQTQIQISQRQAAQPNLFQSEIASLILAKPILCEQNQIALILDEHQSLIVKETLSLKKLKITKTGLMQDLLTGKVRVTPLLEKEPASR